MNDALHCTAGDKNISRQSKSFRNICSGGLKHFNNIEINYPGIHIIGREGTNYEGPVFA